VFRYFTILTMAVMQLLSVSSRPLYLCVNRNGESCCIDHGPESCTCCHHDSEPNPGVSHEQDRSDETASHCESGCCDECEKSLTAASDSMPDYDVLSATHDCGCDHHLLSNGQVSSISRTVSQLTANLDVHLAAVLTAAFHWYGRVEKHAGVAVDSAPPDADSARLLISIVALRC